MGTAPFALVMLLLAAAPSAADQSSVQELQPMAEESFQTLLVEGTLSDLEQGCVEAAAFGLSDRQQQLRDRLLSVYPTPQTMDEVLSNARVLLTCRSPEGARMVLGRYLPGAGADRERWLRLSWQAADAALDHPRAARALRRLVNGDLLALEQLELIEAPGASAEPGEPVMVNGLDQLAHHEEAAGDRLAAAEVLLSGRSIGRMAARRLGRAAELLAEEDFDRADQLLELALDQAAADEAWGLAVDLLRVQLRLQLAAGGDGERPRQRLERLTARLDDQYSSWQLQDVGEPGPALRSPRDPGGHAAVDPLTDAPLP
ncbi:hypothetical protein [Synechococcus sp. KORDI-100]|uniref:hypothetical protein n=1 Tax=Synechococcus sp. KORDI-100 TaxID=1280380 RepID=UPI00056DDEBE|nr:hypothetical protein [Synechococcus sp. KORDI-100]